MIGLQSPKYGRYVDLEPQGYAKHEAQGFFLVCVQLMCFGKLSPSNHSAHGSCFRPSEAINILVPLTYKVLQGWQLPSTSTPEKALKQPKL